MYTWKKYLPLISQIIVRSYKKQIEEAEEIAALNLAKFRQAQGNMSEAFERADLHEQALAKTKARARSASPGPMVRYSLTQGSKTSASPKAKPWK